MIITACIIIFLFIVWLLAITDRREPWILYGFSYFPKWDCLYTVDTKSRKITHCVMVLENYDETDILAPGCKVIDLPLVRLHTLNKLWTKFVVLVKPEIV